MAQCLHCLGRSRVFVESEKISDSRCCVRPGFMTSQRGDLVPCKLVNWELALPAAFSASKALLSK